MDVEEILVSLLEVRNAQQHCDCFEELALLFGCYREGQGHSRNFSLKEDDEDNAEGQRDAMGSGFPTSVFDLKREVLRLRNENDGTKVKLNQITMELKQEKADRQRAENGERSNAESMSILTKELKELREQYRKTEEKFHELTAKNFDLETRMVDEKLKMAETLNSMNEMVQKLSMGGGVGASGMMAPMPSTPPSPGNYQQRDDGKVIEVDSTTGTSANTWTSNVGVALPVKWKILSDANGISIPSLSYNSDGTLLVSGGSDGMIKVWCPNTGARLHQDVEDMTSIKQPILNVDVKGNFILATGDRVCHIFKLGSGERQRITSMHKLTGHAGSVVTGKLTPDCRYAATGGRNVKIWDVTDGNCTRTIDCFSKCLALDVNEQGTLLVTGHADKAIRLWDLRTGKRMEVVTQLHKAPITSVSFSKVGDAILTSSMDHTLAIVDATQLTVTDPIFLSHPEYRANPWWSKATISPGYNSSHSLYAAAGSKDGSLFIWQQSDQKTVYMQKAHNEAITCTAWSPTGTQLATCDNEGAIILWNAP